MKFCTKYHISTSFKRKGRAAKDEPLRKILRLSLIHIFYITLGLISYSLGWAAFLLPYQITTGGTTGIGAIIYYADVYKRQELVHKVVACGDSAGLQFLCDGSNGDGLQRLDGNIPGGSYGDIAVTEEGAVRRCV